METVNRGLIADAGVELDRARDLVSEAGGSTQLRESLEGAYTALEDVLVWARQVNRALSDLGVPIDDLPID